MKSSVKGTVLNRHVYNTYCSRAGFRYVMGLYWEELKR